MTFIVDANIVFSAILNTEGRIGDLLINSQNEFLFIAPDFLHTEIRKHYPKIVKASGLTLEQIQEAEYQIYKDIRFISEEQISPLVWEKAETLTHGVDAKDTPYIAFALHFDCKLWSGDKILIEGLEKKGFTNFISANALFDLREEVRKRFH